ncbi:MAG TPA: HAD-IIIC family phosphatase [Burkholderiales bacterium]|nr:HAD-IIIC family phosphatase [Burkholderiales bacterium]
MEWLPVAPRDFTALCRNLPAAPEKLGEYTQYLATHALDENNINRLSKALRGIRAAGLSLAPLQPFRLGIVSNATSHFLVAALETTAARYGFSLQCVEADFGQVMQEALSHDSTINRAKVDAVLIALDHRGLPLQPTPGDASAARHSVEAALAQLAKIRAGLHQHGNTLCIVQTLPRPVETLFGSFDAMLPGCMRTLIDDFNSGVVESLVGTPDVLLDIAQLAETVGLAEWFNPMLWNMARLPFSNNFIPLYAEHVCRVIAALRGRSRRCLILDLDNTLWGGVIGDDGLEGIVVGQGEPTGEAYLDVQRAALALRARGVLLAVSSKNTDEIARTPFRQHPEMLLREEHIAVFQANWNDKATNIKAIAAELSLGLDAMVLLDDNPVERALVRRILPQVAAPELPSDPALYARTLMAAGYFEAIAFSEEDRRRATFYQENARRVALQSQACDLDDYLASLEMRMQIQPFDGIGRSRIAQLIVKSNQFNLTTRRYSEAQIAEIERDVNCFALQASLSDCFGDNGMISVIICRRQEEKWEIDTWLMSCRVLGRKVERAILEVLCEQAAVRGIRRLIGTYYPTERNGLVKDHYANLGFSSLETEPSGTTVWALDTDLLPSRDLPITICRIGLESVSGNCAVDNRMIA